MTRWQGVEIEYAVPFDEGFSTPARELIQTLAQVDCGRGRPPFLPISSGLSSYLINGGRAYIDHVVAYDLPEFCTAECASARQIVAYECAIDHYVAASARLLAQKRGRPVHCYKTSVAKSRSGDSTTRGLHESYLVRASAFSKCVELLAPYLVCRQLFCGVGGYLDGQYVISPRQFFTRATVSRDVAKDRPFIALGKESLSSPDYYRFHICNGEGARSELTTFLRQSITALVISCIEEGIITQVPRLKDPLEAARDIAKAPDGNWTLKLESGGSIDAVSLLYNYYALPIRELFGKNHPADEDRQALNIFLEILDALEHGDIESLMHRVEWAFKLEVIDRHPEDYFELERYGFEEKQGLDFQYKAVTDPFFEELESEFGLERLTTEEEVCQAMTNPPPCSRGALRVQLALNLDLDEIEWDRVVCKGTKFFLRSLSGWTDEAIAAKVMAIRDRVGWEGAQ